MEKIFLLVIDIMKKLNRQVAFPLDLDYHILNLNF